MKVWRVEKGLVSVKVRRILIMKILESMKVWCVDGVCAGGGGPSLVKIVQVLTRLAFPFVLEGQKMGVSIGVHEGLAC